MTKFYAIADTHLSFGKPKDMSHFGEKWANHTERLANAWRERICAEDVVLLPGDVSWAQTSSKIMPDLAWLSMLPGRKILLRGNHDHWWKDIRTARQLASMYGMEALEGDSVTIEGVTVCGAMGHVAPNDPYFVKDEKKDRFSRELGRLTDALTHAVLHRPEGGPILLMTHYPPFTSQGERTAYVDVITRFQPAVALYGHLHHEKEWAVAKQGLHEGVRYRLVAADYLDMMPIQVWPLEEGAE
jgi:predicted phosphohydrolase